jgi:hypothetical protein
VACLTVIGPAIPILRSDLSCVLGPSYIPHGARIPCNENRIFILHGSAVREPEKSKTNCDRSVSEGNSPPRWSCKRKTN